MANRMTRNYDEALTKAKASQKELIHYLRDLRLQRGSRWLGEDEFQALLLVDPKAVRLSEEASLRWAMVDHRLRQMGACHV